MSLLFFSNISFGALGGASFTAFKSKSENLLLRKTTPKSLTVNRLGAKEMEMRQKDRKGRKPPIPIPIPIPKPKPKTESEPEPKLKPKPKPNRTRNQFRTTGQNACVFWNWVSKYGPKNTKAKPERSKRPLQVCASWDRLNESQVSRPSPNPLRHAHIQVPRSQLSRQQVHIKHK